MDFQKESEDVGIDRKLWPEESQIISFSHYPIKLTLSHQREDVKKLRNM